jgi:hypothetical protein
MHGDTFSTPKDGGYISAANPMSLSVPTPEPQNKDNLGIFGNAVMGDDPFMTSTHQRHLCDYSHDSATGRGIDRI